MIARIPISTSRPVIRTSPIKNTITMKCPISDIPEKAIESGIPRSRCQKVSGGITSAVVLSISRDTGTIEYPCARSESISTGSAATVAERSPPPSCIKMIDPRNCGFAFIVSNWSRIDCAISCGVFRGRSAQSFVSSLLPMIVIPSFWIRTTGAAWSSVSGSSSMSYGGRK